MHRESFPTPDDIDLKILNYISELAKLKREGLDLSKPLDSGTRALHDALNLVEDMQIEAKFKSGDDEISWVLGDAAARATRTTADRIFAECSKDAKYKKFMDSMISMVDGQNGCKVFNTQIFRKVLLFSIS